MKTPVILLYLFLSVLPFTGKTQVINATDKQEYTPIVIDIDEPADVVRQAVKSKFAKKGIAGKPHKTGFVYTKAPLEKNESANQYYAQVDPGKVANTSILTLVPFHTPDSSTALNMADFANDLLKENEFYSTDLDIQVKSVEMKEYEKNMQVLLEERSVLEKKRAEIDQFLMENRQKIIGQQVLISNQNETVTTLTEKRKLITQ